MALPFLFGKGVARMFRKTVETIIGGAIGLVTLYVVAKVAYGAGHDMAEAEHRYEEMSDSKPEDDVSGGAEVPEPDGAESESSDPINRNSKKINKIGLFLSASKLFRKRKGSSMLGDLMKDPEGHQLEAYVHAGEVHINIKKRRSVTKNLCKRPQICAT